MGFILVFFFFLLIIPLLVVGSTLLRLVFGLKTAFQPNNKGFFAKENSENASSANTSSEDGIVGHSELGKKRLNALKNRATDVQFDVIEGNS